jgi:hypothetical protein
VNPDIVNDDTHPAEVAVEPEPDAEPEPEPSAERVEPAEPKAKKKKKKKKNKSKSAKLDEPAPPVRGPVTAGVAATVVAFGLLVVIVVVLGLLEWHRADNLASDRNDRQAAAQVAGGFAQALLTYDSRIPTANLDRLKAMATPTYQPKVEQARNAALTSPSQKPAQTNATASVENVYITELSNHSASAICQANWLVTAGSQTAPPLDFYVKIDLKQQGGVWKVDNVLGVAALTPAGSPPASPSTPTGSSVPAAP